MTLGVTTVPCGYGFITHDFGSETGKNCTDGMTSPATPQFSAAS
jgi:hypothetical protein